MRQPYSYSYITKASYKGVEFIFTNSSVGGGKKTAVKEFVNSDYQLIEELGKKQRSYSVSAYVALVGEEENYITKRDAILAALESPGPGIFVHPVYGAIPNCIVVKYSIDESTDQAGIGTLQIEFGITNVTFGPVEDVLTPSILVQNNKAVTATSQSMIESKFKVNPKLLNVYNSAKLKVTAISDQFKSGVKFAVKATDDVTKAIRKPTDALSNTIADFQRDVVKLRAEGYSMEEICVVMGKSPRNGGNAAKNIYLRAKENVKKIFLDELTSRGFSTKQIADIGFTLDEMAGGTA